MNATALAYGLAKGGSAEARATLARFWGLLAERARWSPLRPTPLDRLISVGDIDFSPGWLAWDTVSRLVSPYLANPANHNPLAEVLADVVDFGWLRRHHTVQLFVCATNVRTGKLKVFGPGKITPDAVLASACLPQLFHAVEIDGEHYWDGGYAANPPVLPLVQGTDCGDTLIVQVDPIRIDELPTTAQAIRERVQVLAFNAGFLREMHALAALGQAVDCGGRGPVARARRLAGKLRLGPRPVRLHLIEAEAEMARLGAASKLDADEAFLAELVALGRDRAAAFLAEHKTAIGARSSLDVAARFL